MSVPAFPELTARARRLRVRVQGGPQGWPAWLAACLANLEDEHVIEHARGVAPPQASNTPTKVEPQPLAPVQDVSLEYAGRILFEELLELTSHSFRERTLGVFERAGIDGARGVHTYDRSARHEVIDVCRSRLKWPHSSARRHA